MNESSASGNLIELEEKINILERSNFDLKMQLFYMTKKYEDHIGESYDNNDNNNNVVINDNSNDILALREELEFYQRKVAELESTNLQLQLLRDNEALEYQKVLKLQPNENFAILEESRNREREVAKTIAEHDAALIKRLQAEIEVLRTQREADQKIVNDCTEKMSTQMDVVQEREAAIANLHAQNLELKNQLDILTDVAKHQEILLNNSNDLLNINNNNNNNNISNSNNNNTINEFELLRKENIVLKDQLQKQTNSIIQQSEILSKLKITTTNMTDMELSETQRLSLELDKIIYDKEQLIITNNNLIIENNKLKEEIAHRDNSHIVENSKEISKIDEQYKFIEKKTIQMYKDREEELLNALAGVIKRCQQLENNNNSK